LRLRVNGQERELAAGASVADLVAAVAPGTAMVAVERNGEIVPRARWAGTALAAGDRCEVVRFVQGG
jgi:thiamine biosynthesis protein ThiS